MGFALTARGRTRIRVAQASQIGRMHLRDRLPNQDASGVRRIGRRGLVLAVADGAGSARHAEIGARTVVEAVLDRCRSAPDACIEEVSGASLLGAAREQVTRQAASMECEPRDLASTMLVVMALCARDRVYWRTVHIGDGVIAGSVGRGVEVVSSPENGEFGNSTFFVTDEMAYSHLRSNGGESDRVSFLLMTDGAAESLYRRGDATLARGVASILSWPNQAAGSTLRRALQSNLRDVISSRTHDDATLVLGSCGPAE